MSASIRVTRLRRGALALALVAATVSQGCATAQNRDPIEPWNRKVFAFNESLDANVLRPVAEGYVSVTPEPLRVGVRNFFNNLRDVWSVVNLFLQGRLADGAQGVMRVSMNTTFGLAGLIDIATPMRLERPNEDLGQTLGVWGVKPGAYIVWPLLGPSTLRDSLNIVPEIYFTGSALTDSTSDGAALTALSVISLRASLLGATGLLDDVALDKYAFTRDAYLQRRQNLIYEGDPPEEEPIEDDSIEDAPPAAGPSSPLPLPEPLPEPQAPEASAGDAGLSVADPAWSLFPAEPTEGLR